ncbi:hypothetical protein [Ethanoligenens harbinense]|uniref:Uncharacterized protein n=1 Tax=Ethanoligenens harbinense (strain DSM 18485 / JCM 12961 / CGMCC 1.5033 / YUAN-3) TaxID=663278 RepID=E6U8P7_ETHHY|nr:hypothetical protein [Ethanoligenens harbinense]ADU27132.1 hypothetical protein Ethha_1597 [Ethanoligenens harbinense YUAN-3]AVQ96208.1 hypothetical protein CXQ68_08200 [Ethanoligenens harbinense YUAN-3]AYF38868.1 hypothetical protein CXP51_08070 [Ethanoligenens harbinense]AYF41618.1 hypothetical protein CN246_08215 [Ethanoligenens harbinense]QCN92448.1 hypothetical protein DRA42_08225 [Ethanoligenens harbinense]
MAENVGAVSFGVHLDISTLETQIFNIGGTAGAALQSVLSGVFSSTVVSGFFDAVGTGFLDMAGGARAAGQNVVGAMSQAWGGIQNIWGGAGGWFRGLWGGMRGVFDGAVGWRDPFAQAWGGIQSIWSGAGGWFDSVAHSVTGAFNGTGDRIRDAFLSGTTFLQSLPQEAAAWGGDIASALAEGIQNAAGAVRTAVSGIAQDIRSFLHFSEPDTGPLVGFHTWPQDMLDGMADDIRGHQDSVLAAVNGLASGMAAALQTAPYALDIRAGMSALNSVQSAPITTNNTRAPVININGPVSLAQAGGKKQLLQQLQFLAGI